MTDVKEPSPLGKSNSDEPDWNGDDPRIVIRDQAAIAVYLDARGDLVIWQRDTLGEEAVVCVAPENIGLLAKAISELVVEPQADEQPRSTLTELAKIGGTK
jgi:hypothetical protein